MLQLTHALSRSLELAYFPALQAVQFDKTDSRLKETVPFGQGEQKDAPSAENV
jgi:hypothetical protein